MKQYTNHIDTPLTFHKFYWKIWTPVQIVMMVYNFITTINEMYAFDAYYAIDMVYYICSAALMLCYIVGFAKWKKSGLVCLYGQLVLNLAYVIVLFVIFAVMLPDEMYYAWGSLFGTLIRCGFVGVYYYKRRALFTKQGITPQQIEEMYRNATFYNTATGQWEAKSYSSSFAGSVMGGKSDAAENHGTEPNTADAPFSANFCAHCGKPIANNPNFCIHCGAKLK